MPYRSDPDLKVARWSPPETDETDYGVDTLPDGNVRLKLGPIQPFDIPPEEAVKLAALLLKHAGWRVSFAGGVINARKTKRLGAHTNAGVN